MKRKTDECVDAGHETDAVDCIKIPKRSRGISSVTRFVRCLNNSLSEDLLSATHTVLADLQNPALRNSVAQDCVKLISAEELTKWLTAEYQNEEKSMTVHLWKLVRLVIASEFGPEDERPLKRLIASLLEPVVVSSLFRLCHGFNEGKQLLVFGLLKDAVTCGGTLAAKSLTDSLQSHAGVIIKTTNKKAKSTITLLQQVVEFVLSWLLNLDPVDAPKVAERFSGLLSTVLATSLERLSGDVARAACATFDKVILRSSAPKSVKVKIVNFDVIAGFAKLVSHVHVTAPDEATSFLSALLDSKHGILFWDDTFGLSQDSSYRNPLLLSLARNVATSKLQDKDILRVILAQAVDLIPPLQKYLTEVLHNTGQQKRWLAAAASRIELLDEIFLASVHAKVRPKLRSGLLPSFATFMLGLNDLPRVLDVCMKSGDVVVQGRVLDVLCSSIAALVFLSGQDDGLASLRREIFRSLPNVRFLKGSTKFFLSAACDDLDSRRLLIVILKYCILFARLDEQFLYEDQIFDFIKSDLRDLVRDPPAGFLAACGLVLTCGGDHETLMSNPSFLEYAGLAQSLDRSAKIEHAFLLRSLFVEDPLDLFNVIFARTDRIKLLAKALKRNSINEVLPVASELQSDDIINLCKSVEDPDHRVSLLRHFRSRLTSEHICDLLQVFPHLVDYAGLSDDAEIPDAAWVTCVKKLLREGSFDKVEMDAGRQLIEKREAVRGATVRFAAKKLRKQEIVSPAQLTLLSQVSGALIPTEQAVLVEAVLECLDRVAWPQLPPQYVLQLAPLVSLLANSDLAASVPIEHVLGLLAPLQHLSEHDLSNQYENLSTFMDALTILRKDKPKSLLRTLYELWQKLGPKRAASPIAKVIVRLALQRSEAAILHQMVTEILEELYNDPFFLELIGIIVDTAGALPEKSAADSLSQIMSHKLIPEILLSFAPDTAPTKLIVARLIKALIDGDKSAIREQYLPVLLSAYDGTLSESGRVIFDVIKSFEGSGIGFARYAPLTFGSQGLVHYTHLKESGIALWNRPSFTEVLACLSPLVVERSIIDFPTSVSMTQVLPIVNEAYGPRFLLPFLAHLVDPGNLVQCDKFIEWNCFGYALAALAAADSGVRSLGYLIISRFKHHAKGSLIKCRKELSRFLMVLRNSITAENARLPKIVTLFLHRCVLAIVKTDTDRSSLEHLLVKIVTLTPNMNLYVIPCFQELFSNESLDHRTFRTWLLTLLRDGWCHTFDVGVDNQQKIMPRLFMYFGTPAPGVTERKLFCEIMRNLASMDTIMLNMRKSNLVCWLRVNAYLFDAIRQEFGDLNVLLNRV